MRLSALALGAGCILTLTIYPPKATAGQRDSETIDRTVSFPDNGTLRVHNFSGEVRITGTSGRDVVVKAVRRAERDVLDRIKFEITTSGSVVTIEANKQESERRNRDENNVVETDLEIQVPGRAALDVDVFSSDVRIAGITGRQNLKTFSGDITTTGVSARIDAETFSGEIDIDAVAAGATPEIDAESFGGTIRARVASTARGAVEFDSFSGSFDSDIPLTLRSSNRRRVSADLPGGTGGRTLRFHTFGGSVRLIR